MSEARQDAPPAEPVESGSKQGNEAASAPVPPEEVQVPALGGAAGDDGPAVAPTWREDWRETLAGNDEKRLKELKRFATPEAFAKSGFDARDRISRGQLAAPDPPEGASDVELAQWRKQVGIPDTPEGYGIAFPEEMKPSDNDKADLAAYLKWAHDHGERPSSAKNFFAFWLAQQAEGRSRMDEQVDEAISKNVLDLRSTFPPQEYVRNFGKNGKGGLVNDFLEDHFPGPDGAKVRAEVLNARVSTGVPLLIYAPFLKGLVNMARDVASADRLIGGDSGAGGKSLDEEYKELVAVSRPTDAQRQRMTQIQETKISRDQRHGRSRAA